MVSPDSPISPKDGQGTDSHFADEERGSQRIGNSAGSGRTAMATQLAWPPKTVLFMRPVFHAQHSSNSCRLICVAFHLHLQGPQSHRIPCPLSAKCTPLYPRQGGCHGRQPSPAASITRALPPHQCHLPPQNSPMEALVPLKVLDTQKLVSLGQGVCPGY